MAPHPDKTEGEETPAVVTLGPSLNICYESAHYSLECSFWYAALKESLHGASEMTN